MWIFERNSYLGRWEVKLFFYLIRKDFNEATEKGFLFLSLRIIFFLFCINKEDWYIGVGDVGDEGCVFCEGRIRSLIFEGVLIYHSDDNHNNNDYPQCIQRIIEIVSYKLFVKQIWRKNLKYMQNRPPIYPQIKWEGKS